MTSTVAQLSPEARSALTDAEMFIRGFDGDETQVGVSNLLARLRAVLDGAPGYACGEIPTLVINVSGGVVQGASCEVPVNVVTLDYDSDGVMIPPDQFSVDAAPAEVGECGALVDPVWVAEVVRALNEHDASCEDDDGEE